MDLTLETRDLGGRTVVVVGGEVDVYTAPALRDTLTELVGAGRHHLVVDMTGVQFLDITGLATVFTIHESPDALSAAG